MKKTLRKAMSVFLAVLMLISISAGMSTNALAATYTKDNFVYYYEVIDGKITINSVDYDNDNDESVPEKLTFPSKIKGKKVVAIKSTGWIDVKEITIPNSVKTLGADDYYFGVGNYETKIINLGKGVKEIKPKAFAECGSLTKITVDKDNPYFSVKSGSLFNKKQTQLVKYIGSKKVTEYTVPKTVKTIKQFAFEYNSTLSAINISNAVTTLESDAFGYSDIKTVKIGKGLKTLSGDPFSGCANIKKITVDSKNPNFSSKDGALYNKKKTKIYKYPVASKATSFTIPSTVVSIGTGAFSEAKNLQKVVASEKTKKISNDAFCFCTNLNMSFTKLDKIETIGNAAFYATKIKKVVLPKTVTKIGYSAFANCEKLTTADLSKATKLKTINENTFRSGYKLSNVKFSKSITNIKAGAFDSCDIKEITLPSKLEKLGEGVFENADLETITIPASVKSVGNYAFADNERMTSIIVKGKETALKKYSLPIIYEWVEIDEYDEDLVEKKITKIIAPEGSKAETFAKKYGFEFEKLA